MPPDRNSPHHTPHAPFPVPALLLEACQEAPSATALRLAARSPQEVALDEAFAALPFEDKVKRMMRKQLTDDGPEGGRHGLLLTRAEWELIRYAMDKLLQRKVRAYKPSIRPKKGQTDVNLVQARRAARVLAQVNRVIGGRR